MTWMSESKNVTGFSPTVTLPTEKRFQFYDNNGIVVDDSNSGGAQGKQGSFGLERLMLCVCFWIKYFSSHWHSNSQFLTLCGMSLCSACSSLWMFVARRWCTKYGNVIMSAIHMKSEFLSQLVVIPFSPICFLNYLILQVPVWWVCPEDFTKAMLYSC